MPVTSKTKIKTKTSKLRCGQERTNMLDKFKLKVRMKLAQLLTWKVKTLIVLMFLSLGAFGFYKINQFFETHKFVFESPVSVHLQTPIYLVDRVLAANIIITKSENKNSPLTPDQQYACNLFGKDCATAIAIMRAESHYRHDAININSNGTADLGCFQINTIHLKNIDTTNINLLNCKDNSDVAYRIFKQQGNFTAWVAYTSGAYKQFLLN